jgi:hypothetical protein
MLGSLSRQPLLVALADQRCPEPGLADAMLLPDAQRVVLEAGEQRRQSAGHAAINAQLVDHDLLHFVSVMPRRRLHGAPPASVARALTTVDVKDFARHEAGR